MRSSLSPVYAPGYMYKFSEPGATLTTRCPAGWLEMRDGPVIVSIHSSVCCPVLSNRILTGGVRKSISISLLLAVVSAAGSAASSSGAYPSPLVLAASSFICAAAVPLTANTVAWLTADMDGGTVALPASNEARRFSGDICARSRDTPDSGSTVAGFGRDIYCGIFFDERSTLAGRCRQSLAKFVAVC